jgi:2'-5' RNA ligase
MQPRSLHLTLAFLGDTDPAARDAAIAAAGDVGVVPFEFVIDRSGFFRQGRERGVLWAGGGAPAALEALASDLRARLAATGVPFDRKAFVPHVTLLRGARAPLAPIAIAPIVWRVRDFALVASTRDAGGPVYRSLARPFGSSR